MKTMIAPLVIAITTFSSVANAQQTITPPAEGIAIVDGGNYPSGTVYANGKAYPPGTKMENAQTFETMTMGSYSTPGMLAMPAPGIIQSGYRYSPSYYGSGISRVGYNSGVGIGIGNTGFYYGNGFNNGFYGNGFYGNGYSGNYGRNVYGNSWNNGYSGYRSMGNTGGGRGRGGRYR